MAARGRFGRSDTGTSNLSALIRQLVSQQQAMEEKAIMDAFYNGLQYNGSVPTMDDVKAFYAKWVNLTGIQPGDADWNVIQQKVEGANNFDIKRTYQDLQATFESTNGSNYQEVVDFLKGRATESTDPQDTNVYEQAFGIFSSNYIKYRGEDLVNGLINISDYRSMSQQALSAVGADDPIYKTMLNDSYDYEWRSESSKKENLVRGGELSMSSYLKWAKGFKDAILSAGIPTTSDLYARVVGTIGSISKTMVGNAAKTRLNTEMAGISSIWSVLKQRYGAGEEKFYFGKTQSQSDMLNEISQHPEWAQAYSEFLKDNPKSLDPSLAQQGITADNFLQTFESRISGAKSEASLLESQGIKANADKLSFIAYNSGVDSIFDYLKYTDVQWQKERAAARENDQTIAWLDKEYVKFMTGQDSYFGNLGVNAIQDPNANLQDWQRSVVQATYNAVASHQYQPGIQTISSYGLSPSDVEKTVDPQLINIALTAQNAEKLSSGELVNVWNESKKLYEPQSPRNAGLAQGQFQMIVVAQLPDGTTQAQTQIVYGTQVKDQATGAKLPIWSLTMPDGTVNIVGTDGSKYKTEDFVSLGNGEYVSGTQTSATKEEIPRVYMEIKDTRESDASIAQRPGENYLAKIAPSSLAYAESLRVAASAAVEAARGIQDPEARKALLGDNYKEGDLSTVTGELFTRLIGSADEISVQAYAQRENPTLTDRATLADYAGNQAYSDFLRNQSQGYTEVAPNIWIPKGSAGRMSTSMVDSLIKSGTQAVGTPLTAGGQPDILSTIGSAFGALFGGGQGEVKDFRTDQEKQAQMQANIAKSAATPMSQAQYSPGGGNPFFRNLTTPTAAPLPGVLGYLNTTPVTPPVSVPKPVAPAPYVAPKVGGPSYGKPPAIPPKIAPIITTGPRAGQPAGGGL